MRNPNDEYDRLHDHMTAIARERDALKLEVERLTNSLLLIRDAFSELEQ